MSAREPSEGRGVLWLILALLAGVFVLDLLTPLGYSDAALYLIPLGLTIWLPQRRGHFIVLAVVVALIVVGALLSPPSTTGAPPSQSVYNRSACLAALLAVGMLVNRVRQAQDETHRQLAAQAARLVEESQKLERELAAHRTAEEALRRSEARYRSLYEAVAGGIIMQDASGAIIEANPAATAMLGLTLDQVLGRTSADPRWQAIREDGSPSPADYRPNAVVFRTGQPVRDMVTGIVHAQSGERRWLLVNTQPVLNAATGQVQNTVSVMVDITARKQAEEALRRNEARYRGLFDALAGGIVVTDAAGKIVDANRAAEEMAGTTVAEVRGQPTAAPRWGFLRDDGSSLPFEDLPSAVVRRTKQPVRDVVLGVMNQRLNERRWFLSHAQPLLDPDTGELQHVVTAFVDITAWKKAEEALRKSEVRYRGLYEAVPGGVVVHNTAGNVVEANSVAAVILGRTVDELLRRSTVDPGWEAFREDGSLCPTESRPTALALRMGEPVRDVIMGFDRGEARERRWLLVNVQPILDPVTGRAQSTVTVFFDITGRKQAEEALRKSEARFRSLYEAVPGGVVVSDAAGKAIDANPEAAAIFGLPLEKLLGASAGDSRWRSVREDGSPLHPEDSPPLVSVRTGRPVRNFVVGFVHRETGERRWALSNTHPIPDAATGRPGATMNVLIDITARREAEEALTKAHAELEAAKANLERQVAEQTHDLREAYRRLVHETEERRRIEALARSRERLAVLGELAAGVAHEFRNPLQGVTGFLDLVRGRMAQDAETAELLDRIAEGLRHMDQTAARLLDLSRQESGPTMALPLAPVIERAFAFMQVQADKKRVALRQTVSPDLPLVEANPSRVIEALLNLLSNSLDACSAGGVITVSARRHPKRPGLVELLVADTGTGIPPGLWPKVFDPFFTTKPFGKGSGLGLAMVRKIAEGAGGYAELVDATEQGATFGLGLPIATEKSAGEDRDRMIIS